MKIGVLVISISVVAIFGTFAKPANAQVDYDVILEEIQYVDDVETTLYEPANKHLHAKLNLTLINNTAAMQTVTVRYKWTPPPTQEPPQWLGVVNGWWTFEVPMPPGMSHFDHDNMATYHLVLAPGAPYNLPERVDMDVEIYLPLAAEPLTTTLAWDLQPSSNEDNGGVSNYGG